MKKDKKHHISEKANNNGQKLYLKDLFSQLWTSGCCSSGSRWLCWAGHSQSSAHWPPRSVERRRKEYIRCILLSITQTSCSVIPTIELNNVVQWWSGEITPGLSEECNTQLLFVFVSVMQKYSGKWVLQSYGYLIQRSVQKSVEPWTNKQWYRKWSLNYIFYPVNKGVINSYPLACYISWHLVQHMVLTLTWAMSPSNCLVFVLTAWPLYEPDICISI